MKTLKAIVFSQLLVLQVLASSNVYFGQKLEMVKQPNGKPKFGMQYTTSEPKMLAITFSVKGYQLVGSHRAPIVQSFWAMLDKKSISQLSDWVPTRLTSTVIDPGSTVAMTVEMSNPNQVTQVLKSLSNSVLVLSLNSSMPPMPNVYLDLSELCNFNPDQFLNLDTLQTGCN